MRKIRKVMNRQKKCTTVQVNQDNFSTQVLKAFFKSKYKDVFKGSTQEYYDVLHNLNYGKREYGVQSVSAIWNKNHLPGLYTCKLTATVIFDAISQKQAGKSPPKQGWSSIIHKDFTNALVPSERFWSRGIR